MTLSEITTKVNSLTHTTPTISYLAANRLIDLNNAQDEIQMAILRAQDGDDFDDKNYTDNFPIKTADLVADQRDYTLPTDMIKFKRLTITYDGTNWYKAMPFDIGETDEILKDANFSTQRPMYDLQDNSVKLYPAPTANVTGGLKIWVSRRAEEFTSAEVTTGTKEPGFDRAYHKIIPYKMALEFAYENLPEKVGMFEQKITVMIAEMQRDYSNKQKDGNMIVKAGYVNYE